MFQYFGDIPSTPGDLFSFILFILVATTSGVTTNCPNLSPSGPLNFAPPLTGPKPSTRKEEGCCQERHPSVKVSQSRIMAFNATAINARASPIGDAVHTRPRGLTNVRGLPCQDRWSRLKKQVGRLRVVSWNVGTMTGNAVEIADVLSRRKVDIACVQEVKWKGSEARNVGHGYKLFFYHGDTSYRNGEG